MSEIRYRCFLGPSDTLVNNLWEHCDKVVSVFRLGCFSPKEDATLVRLILDVSTEIVFAIVSYQGRPRFEPSLCCSDIDFCIPIIDFSTLKPL